MKKRILSLLMAFVMVVSLLPATALAADAVTEISSAEAFAAMDSNGNYKLTKDIEVTKPYTSSFRGTFDGDGHTVTLKLNVTSGNAGLFSETGSGAVIENVEVSADVTSNVASSSYGTAGLVGKVSGTTTITNCGVTGTVSNTATTTHYAARIGSLVGYFGGALTLNDCYSTANISSKSTYSSSAAGGLIGGSGSAYPITAENCYFSGNVDAKNYAGGFIGYLNSSTSKPHAYTNCYTSGTVTGGTNKAYGFAYSYASTGYNFTNCYYNSINANGCNKTDAAITAKTSGELKALASTLGNGFRADLDEPINGGYPILSWQYIDPTKTHTVSFTVDPKDSVLTWNGEVKPVSTNGKYEFADVAVGSYDYSVSNAGDYATAEGTVTVKNKDVVVPVTLELNKHTLTFALTPQDAELIVQKGDKELKSNSDGSYSVVNGTYSYTASKFGYETAKGTVTVDRADKEQSVTMTKEPSATVRFVYAKDAEPTISVSYAKSQWNKIPMSAENDGSYQLPIGYKYEWSFDSAAYIAQSGTIDLTEAKKDDTKDIPVPMSKKPTGTGTVEDPYLISDASQLRWFASQVNDNGKNSICAQLTNDIDLNNVEWTPIGKSSSYSYNGTFDGQYHEIKNLKITGSASNHYGLFGVVGTGTVKNLTVSGEVSVTSNNNSYGIAAIVGCMNDGSAGTVENCINKANVSGGQNVAGIVGYISSGYSFNKKVVQNCANYGSISSTSNNAAGIAANISGAVTIQDCYNRGTITGGGWHAGGITAYLNSSYATIKNCYTTGSVSGSDSNPVIGKKGSGTITNCYYLDTLGKDSDSNAESKTSDELKALAPKLGGAFIKNSADINDGYPIFRWQIPTYDVTFTVDPADAQVTIVGQTGTRSGSNWTFALPDGEYDYTVSAFGYGAKSGKITVSGGAVHEAVTLTAVEKRTVTFNIAPAGVNAAVTVIWNGKTISAESDGSYLLPEGKYTYTVKAKGYAKETKELTVSKNETVSVTLTLSTAWDGTTKTQPTGQGTQASPYEIADGEHLAWLANAVNKADSGAKFYAELTDDIDLGGNPFTPIGKDFHEFSGSFDGKGYTISGLNVTDVADAGLFGTAKDATIRNVVVRGNVTGTDNAAGILAKAKTTACTIENCGNEAVVNVIKSGGGYAGGILGYAITSTTVTNCYNSGAVTSKGSTSYSRASGIVGYLSGNGSAKITTCYNTGKVTSDGYATGIYGSNSVTIKDSYTTGSISGKDAASTGAFSTGKYDTLTNCYYLTGSIPEGAKVGDAAALTLAEMQSGLLDKLGTENWKSVRGVNNSLPVLKWQSVSAPTASVELVSDAAFVRSVINTEDGDETSLPTAQLQWTPVTGAESYTVSLWRAEKTWVPLTAEEKAEYDAISSETSDFPSLEKLEYVNETAVISRMTAEQKARLATLDAAVDEAESDPEQMLTWYNAMENRAAFIVSLAKDSDLGSYTSQLAFAQDISGVTETQYDLTDTFAVLPEGIYYAAVAVETDGQAAYVPSEKVNDEVVGIQSPYNRMKTVTGVKWVGATAKWVGRENFTGIYQIDLYLVSSSGENRTYTSFRSFSMPGQYTSANLTNAVAAEKQYAFTVTAIADSTIDRELGLTDSVPSAYSKVYTPSAGTEKPSEKEWVDISTAEQWIALANVKDAPSDSSNSSSPSKQAIEWSKNYRLTADIDFSKLSAADQMKTKSIGTVTYPFMGEFDGQGHKITGLTLSNSDSGLFWYTGATAYVHDLTIDSANVLFSDNAAVLVHNNYGRLEKCAVVNTNITADTGAVLGGMVSRNYGVIRESYVQGGTLTSNTTSSVGHAGFVGANEAGGLIERCWSSMDISTQSAHAAGFVGLGYGGAIKNCFALGNVSARGYSGGFVGRSVYQGNVYENCYAAGTVTVTDKEGNGFIGGNQDWSSFQYDQTEGITNCYYNSSTASSHDYNAVAKSLDEMKADTFLTALSGSESGIWVQDSEYNNGLPYLSSVKAPETAQTTQITVNIAIAAYNKDTYSFEKSGDVISVTMDSNGNTRLVDLMDAAQAQGKLTYTYSTSTEYGRFIHTINGREVNAPDGWMFTINDKLSNVSASLATVQNGDQVLWFEGTTENHFQGPAWDSLSGESIQWNTISTKGELLALAKAKDAETLSKNYKLTADLNLSDETFPGIGTAEHPFTGRFDGQNHTISNVTVSGADKVGVGFFGVIRGATIRSLNLTNVTITGKEKVGGLVGYAQAALDKNDLSKNIANLIGGCTVSGTVSGEKQTGGLVGLNEGKADPYTLFSIASTIDKSSADVTVTGKEMTGGLVGENTGTITKSAATGAVTGTTMTGGFAGSSSGDIYDSHAEGTVTGSSHTGGFAGSSSGAVKNCYSLGAVTGTDYTGAFTGSLAAADTVIGAGQVTITGTPTQGYNGGLAGSLSGTVSGPANRITVKNAFGNCTQAEGENLSVIGNTNDYRSDGQKAALEGMTLSTHQAVGDKLYELFGINRPGTSAETEAGKYTDAVTVSANAEEGSVISLLKPEQTAAPDVTVTYAVTDAHLTGGSTLTLVKPNDTCATVSIQVELLLTDGEGNTYRKSVQVILPVTPEKRTELMDAIASVCIDTKDAWTAMDMAVYSALPGKTAKLTDAAKQNILNLLIKEANSREATLSAHSRIEIVLRSLGIDSRKLYPVNSNAAVDNAAKLTQMAAQADQYAAPYVLLADLQGNAGLTSEQVNTLIGVLKANMGTGLFSYERNGVTYASPDTAGAALAALAKYYGTSTDAKAVVDTILVALSSAMDANGSFGSANSDAMVMIGLLALGKDPAAMTSVSGASVVDGMLSYVNTGTNQFRYSGEDNALATEQAFRALAALAHFEKGKAFNKAFNVYDFSANPVEPGRATGSGETEAPKPPFGTEITVRMTIKADSGYWFNGSVTIPGEGATVYYALIKALGEAGMSQVGAESGYVRSISKDGKTLSEFDNGENSGWLYKVNGDLPDVGLTSYAIKDGDRIVWYYTDDWTLDPDAGKWYVKPVSSTITPAAVIKDGIASASVSYKDLSEAISAAKKSGEDTVTITPEIKGKVNGIAVSLPKSAAANAAKQGVQLIVETDKARVSLRAEVLGELAKNSGSELKLEITEKRAEEVSDKLAHENLDGASIVEVTLMIDGKPVTVFGGKKLLIDIPVDSKRFRAGDTCRVLVLSDDGAAERTSGQCIKKNDALFVRVETTHLSIFVVMRDAALPFTDVADTAWYADAVQYVYENGLMTGVSESEFAPDGTATRGQIVTILWRLAGSPVVNYAMRYADADEGAWYGEAVRWAASTGVVTGYSESSFGPNDAITREQLAAILYRYVKTQGQGFTGMWYFPLRYDDAASISSWADEAMHWCVMKGLLNGTSETTLSPQLTATRAQLAAILQRFCELPKDTASKSAAQTAYDRASAYLTAAVSAPRYGSLGGEWTVLALARGGADTETAYFTDYYAALEQTVREANGVLSERKYTEYSRVILALSALGKDARDVAGYDLTLPLGDFEKAKAQGMNGAIYALLALDSRDYPMPQNAAANTQATRQLYVDAILAAQLADGGWSFMGEDADPDLTAMALQALAKYREQSSVQLAANRALVCLSAMQNADGGFSSWGSENAESCAQVLLALNALDLGTDDSRFVKNGHSVLDALLTYQNADGGFCHERGGETNLMASEQAACALASLVRAERGESGLYRMAALTQPAA